MYTWVHLALVWGRSHSATAVAAQQSQSWRLSLWRSQYQVVRMRYHTCSVRSNVSRGRVDRQRPAMNRLGRSARPSILAARCSKRTQSQCSREITLATCKHAHAASKEMSEQKSTDKKKAGAGDGRASPSRLVDLVSPVSACFVAVYGAESGRGRCAEILPLLMMRPPMGDCAFMTLNASWEQRKVPVKFVSTTGGSTKHAG